MRLFIGTFFVLCSMLAPAAAQMSVTTIGATDAVGCFQNAADEFTSETDPCDRALKDPGTTRADRKKTLVNRGVIHNRNGNLSAALNDFNNALQIDGDLGEAYLNRGNSHFLSGRYDDAMSDYRRALDLDVSKPWAAWYNIGLVYQAQKNADKAREAYENALSANPNFTQARQKLENSN